MSIYMVVVKHAYRGLYEHIVQVIHSHGPTDHHGYTPFGFKGRLPTTGALCLLRAAVLPDP